jgi:hypothetical protein
VIEVRNVNIPRALLNRKDATGKPHRGNRTSAPCGAKSGPNSPHGPRSWSQAKAEIAGGAMHLRQNQMRAPAYGDHFAACRNYILVKFSRRYRSSELA